jgi:hypothetical protein
MCIFSVSDRLLELEVVDDSVCKLATHSDGTMSTEMSVVEVANFRYRPTRVNLKSRMAKHLFKAACQFH